MAKTGMPEDPPLAAGIAVADHSGALSLAARVGVKGLGRLIAVCAGGFGASLILFASSRSLWLSVILLVPVGFTMRVQMASSNTLLQSMSPDQ